MIFAVSISSSNEKTIVIADGFLEAARLWYDDAVASARRHGFISAKEPGGEFRIGVSELTTGDKATGVLKTNRNNQHRFCVDSKNVKPLSNWAEMSAEEWNEMVACGLEEVKVTKDDTTGKTVTRYKTRYTYTIYRKVEEKDGQTTYQRRHEY